MELIAAVGALVGVLMSVVLESVVVVLDVVAVSILSSVQVPLLHTQKSPSQLS